MVGRFLTAFTVGMGMFSACAAGDPQSTSSFGSFGPTGGDGDESSGSGSGSDGESGDGTADSANDAESGMSASTSGTSSEGGTSSDGGESSSDGGDGDPMEEILENDNNMCTMFLWCSDNMTMLGSGPHTVTECFNAGLTPPFNLTRVTYEVDAVEAVNSFTLQVRSFNGATPGNVIGTQNLNAGMDAAVGGHTIDLQNPIQVNTAGFCVGFDGNDAFALSRDESAPMNNRSFLIAPNCSINSFATVESLGFPGNHCLAATIEK